MIAEGGSSLLSTGLWYWCKRGMRVSQDTSSALEYNIVELAALHGRFQGRWIVGKGRCLLEPFCLAALDNLQLLPGLVEAAAQGKAAEELQSIQVQYWDCRNSLATIGSQVDATIC
jgi:hypothetical protein